MDYTDARDAFFQPRTDAPAPGTDTWQTRGRRLRDVLEPVATICYWSEPAYDAYAALGLDFLGGYVYGRGCVLGAADGAVVASAFGVFEPGLVSSTFDASRDKVALGDIREARVAGSTAALEGVLGDGTATADVERVTAVLERGLAAADPTGRALYTGLSSLPTPSTPLGALWHTANRLREYRGDSHLAACVAAGLSGLEANLMTEMAVGWEPRAYTGTRGWAPEAMDAAEARLSERGLVHDGRLSEGGRRVRDEIENVTELLVAPVLDAIGDDLDDVVEVCDRISQRILERGWFPPDPFKRASG